jgi:cysteine desulfurase / selenocysteine lyase
VLDQMVETYARLGVSPGRGGYDLAVEAGDLLQATRRKVAHFFGASDPDRAVFAANATDALNLAIQGLARPGDHVVSTRLEHNSVLRPLFHLRARGWIDYDLVPFDGNGLIDPEEVARSIRPNTRFVVICHASNVLGTVQPVAAIARKCAEKGVPVIIDTAQSAGHVPIEIEAWGVGAAAFTGHKGLLGPSGIGGLVLSPELDIDSTRFGGTGIESRSPTHTQTYPHRLEAGTLNFLGVIGLSAGLDFLESRGMERLHQREMALTKRLHAGLAFIPGVTVHSPAPSDDSAPVLSCSIQGMDAEDVGTILDGDYGIAVRTGLHCAPLVHADLGTSAQGTVRFSLGYSTTEVDVDAALRAMAAISASC